MEGSTPRIRIEVTATITITSAEAYVLEHLTSYSLAEWFTTHCNKSEVSEKTIKSTLDSLRSQLHRVLHAQKLAADGVNEALKGEKL
jgi:hypothetical protein